MRALLNGGSNYIGHVVDCADRNDSVAVIAVLVGHDNVDSDSARLILLPVAVTLAQNR